MKDYENPPLEQSEEGLAAYAHMLARFFKVLHVENDISEEAATTMVCTLIEMLPTFRNFPED